MAQDARDLLSRLRDRENSGQDPPLSQPPSMPDEVSAHSADSGSNSDNKSPGHGTSDSSTVLSRPAEFLITANGNRHPNSPFYVRTLPAWIRPVEHGVDDENESTATDRLLPSQPNGAVVAHHNHSPSAILNPQYEHLRGESIDTTPFKSRAESRWKTFSRSIAYPRQDGMEEKIVTPEWMNENHGDYRQPWRGQLPGGADDEDPLKAKRRRELWFKRLHTSLLRSPVVPLILRLTVWFFSLMALALGASIQHLSHDVKHMQGGSALMAIIVDAVALVYLIYITWDEYTSKPLGLRSPRAKARLVLLDIFFIVFDSANLSLAFDSLTAVEGSCTSTEINSKIDPRNDAICNRQKALASVLLIALLAWLMTFSISILRLVERVSS
ncbi:hypothetical protein ASPZODRAFT_128482 [Penicilliopsis zonata CBS 506.65]|uniref:Regulator of phospholipase D SRF1 n=1 Tax=Penicilliopsis zonata CBS 506.65 TaxID=1073090 RepID=A0A1L9SRT4_9EURO|nr:hypothetical protein ASPZODRAFT_128482 [Penicilliopsis zonata CBS 506.65]OJJ49912.1 hypothetical protein ASPZODRAFT_128482 [Penicilliopsis zonata CBS 506.65]